MNNNALANSKKNILISFLGQVIILSFSLILPRLILSYLGSEINGFLSTVNQIFSYLEILRAGVGMAALQALYKPITSNDTESISIIISSSKKYFDRLGKVYLLLTIAIGFVLSIKGSDGLGTLDIFIIVLSYGVSGWISFSKINWFIDLLRAEGKNYVFLFIQLFGTIGIKILEIIFIVLTKNPVLVKTVSVFVMIFEYICFSIYRKKFYYSYNFKKPYKLELLKNRKSYLTFHISSLICTNTDVVILSLFCGYKISSVYSIYYMITFGVATIVNTLYSSTSFILGHSYQGDIKKFTSVHDTYYLYYTVITSALFSVCYVLIVPFVVLYTKGITDVNYFYEFLPLLFCINQILGCGKNIGEITVNLGGKAKEVVWRSVLEASINISISLILVNFIGIYGVLIGTSIALLYRLIDVVVFTNRKIMFRSAKKNFFMTTLNILLFFSIVVFSRLVKLEISNYIDFFVYAILISITFVFLFFFVNSIIFRSEFSTLRRFVKKRK